MKTYLLALCLTLFTALLATLIAAPTSNAAQSGQAQTDPQTTQESQPKTQAVTGEIVSLDPTNKVVVLKDSAGKELRLMASDTTQVYREGQTITLAELKTSEKVICEVEAGTNGTWMVKSIRVGSMKAGK